ncbi:hypothetical protein [Cytobacillus firmus]|uniref:hypothetical protein n=1 Tax=Cytobacillus firmus TaxID=1399 RepID=UPI0018CCDAAA|nr:hypothetical protein [Cytobacillus firmus]MBG9586604.1 hypothetical protein [Cytobacillus firmus]
MKNNTSFTGKAHSGKYTLETLHYILNNELSKYKSIKVPNINHSLSGEELASWLIDSASPQELEELVLMVNQAKKRSSDSKAIFQIAAAALIK